MEQKKKSKNMKSIGRKLTVWLLTLAMVVGLMPGMSMTVYAANSNEGWTDCYPEDGEYVLVCKADPTKVLTYYESRYQFSTYNGDSGQKWTLKRIDQDKPSYAIIFAGDRAMDVPAWDDDLEYGDSMSTLSFANYGNFSEYETNVFRFSQRENGPTGQEYAIRVVSEAESNYDFVLEGNPTSNYGALTVQQYNDNQDAQYWSFVAVDDYVNREHTHTLNYTANGDSIIATCTNGEGLCFLENRQSVLKLTPPSNITKVETTDEERKAQIVISGDEVTATKAFTNENTNVEDFTYYKATKDGSTYVKTGEELDEVPKEVGDYVVEVKINVNDNEYTLSTGYSILNRIIAGAGTTTDDYLPTSTGWKYLWSQQIYDKGEVNASGNITAIDFYNTGDTKTRNLEIYMAETDKESFTNDEDWVSLSEDGKVFSGEVTFNSGEWTTITFNTPFGYLGNKNLLLCVRDITGSYSSGAKFKAGETSTEKAICVYNDNDGAYDISNPNESGNTKKIRNMIRLEIQDFIPVTVTLNGGGNSQTSGGATTQSVLTGAMTPVTYTANDNYIFEPFEDIINSGITVTRTNDTIVTVSGKPESDVTLSVPDAIYHAHNFTYEVDGATITARCSDSDLHPQGYAATLTIGEPLHKKYNDGLDAVAQITDESGIKGEAVVEYYRADESGEKTGGKLSSAPTDAGTYWAEITLGSGDGAKTAHVVYTINKGDATSLSEGDARQALNISYNEETATIGSEYDISSDGQNPADLTDDHLNLAEILNDEIPKIYVRRSETENISAGSWVEVSLVTRPAAPTGLTTENATNGNTTDGKINGTTDDLEYKNSEDGKQPADWTVAGAIETTGLKPGIYLVRIKATDSAPHGLSAEVEVGSNYILLTEAAPAITIKEKGSGNTEEGIPQIGDTLTAIPVPANANPVTYEWYRGETKIDGVTGADYDITAADVGSKIHVIAKQEENADGVSSAEVTTTHSADTETVKKKTNTVVKITVEALKTSTSKTGTSITVKPVTAGYEYTVVAKDTTPADNAWKTAESGHEADGLEFTGLDSGTEYDVLVRALGSEDTQPGEATKIVVVTNVELTITGTPIQGKETNVTLTPPVSGVTYKWYIGADDTPDGTGTKVVPTTGGDVLKVEAYAGDPEALIGTATTSENVKSLATFISESTDSPVTVVLDGPITGGITIPDNKEVILDLNGQKVDGNISVLSGSKLTIIDSSSPQTGTVTGTVSANTGEVIITGGRYNNNPAATNPGTVVITGGMFKNEPTLDDTYGTKGITGDYTYQVLPRATVSTVPVAKTELKYNGNNQTLIIAGETGDGSIYYALGNDDSTAPAFDGTTTDPDRKWYTSVPTGKEAGTYYVWYMVKGDASHSDTVAAYISVNIAVGEPSVREVLANAIEYETGMFKKGDKYEIFVGTSEPEVTDPATEIPTGGYDLLGNIVDADVNHDQDPNNDKKLYVRIKKGSEKSEWVYVPLPGRQSTDGITVDYNKDTLTGVYPGVKYSTNGSVPSTEWTASDSADLTKTPVSWAGNASKTLKFIVPGDQEKQLFPSKVKEITLGTKGAVPTAGDLDRYPVEGENVSYRSANLPVPKDETKKLQYRYKKKDTNNWTSWGSSDKAIGLEMGTEYDYQVRFAPETDTNGNPTGPASLPLAGTFTTRYDNPDAIEFLDKYVDYSASPAKFIGSNDIFETGNSETATNGTDLNNNGELPTEGFYVRYKAKGGMDPSGWTFIPRVVPDEVNDVTAENETYKGLGGKLNNTDNAMEYRYRKGSGDDWTDWIPCTADMTGLTPGDYQIRKKATGSELPSFARHLTISEGTSVVIKVIVIDSGENPVTEAKVSATLVGGNTVSSTETISHTGEYNITGLSVGTYQIVVTGTDGHQVTTLTDVMQASATVTLILPTGKDNSSKLVDNTGNNFAVGGIDDQARNLDSTESTKEYLIIFKAEEKSETDSDSDTVNKINEIKDKVETDTTYKDSEGKPVDVQKEFMDFTVVKTLISNSDNTADGVGDTTNITSTSRVMEIVYPYPMINSRFGIMIWRYHNGTVEKFTRLASRPAAPADMKDGTYYIDRLEKRLYIYANQFSIYSVTYTENSDIKDPEPGNPGGGGGTGGGGGGTTTYTPAITKPEHGTITVNPASPQSGQNAVVTVTPDEGYETEDVIVKDKDGNTVPVTKNDDGTYTFTQPATGPVTIEAVIRQATDLTPVIKKPEHGTISVNPAKPKAGEPAIITVTPDEGYEVDSVIVTDKEGKPVAFTLNEDGTYSFDQPASGCVTIEAVLRLKNGVIVRFDLNGKTGTEPDPQTFIKGGKAVRPNDPAAEGYTFTGWYTDEKCKNAYDFDTPVNEDIILYAGWEKKAGPGPEDDDFGIYFAELFDDPYDGVHYNADYNDGEGRYEIVYTGAPIKPLIRVTSKADGVLKEGIDYSVSYSNNKNYSKKKPATIKVSGKGFYKSKKVLELYILQADLEEAQTRGLIAGADELKTLSGKKLNPVIVYRGYKLKNSDLNLSNKDKITADTITDITGKGNFTGTLKDVEVKVIGKDDQKKGAIKVNLKAGQHVYNGEAHELSITTADTAGELTVTAGSSKAPLEEGTDFVVSYSGNTDAGKAAVAITGIGEYNGTVVKNFTIEADKTTDITPELAEPDEPVYFNVRGAKPDITVTAHRKAEDETVSDEVLTEGKDYNVSYSSNMKIGDGAYTVKFLGNYKGHKDANGSFKIVQAPIDEAKVEAVQMIYKKPGKYLPKPFVSIDGVQLKNSDYTYKYYIGEEEITSKYKLSLADDETSKTVRIVVTGKGNYTNSTAEGTYEVVRRTADAIDLSKAKIVAKDKVNGKDVKIGKQEYNGTLIEPEIRVLARVNKKWVEVDPSLYTVSYINNLNKGSATILVTGDGEEAIGSKTVKFSISTMSFELFKLIFGE